MKMDDPTKPEFASIASYSDFAFRVRYSQRYVWDKRVQAFLDTLLATSSDRKLPIPKGSLYYRAQHGTLVQAVHDEHGFEIGEEETCYLPERMIPLPYAARQGRANPAGIPVLYLGNSEETAISEVRPWVGAGISVAQFQVEQDLSVIDLRPGHGQFSLGHLTFAKLEGDEEPTAEDKLKSVWIEVDNAFSTPVTSADDAADYVPTQILAELFRRAGYDGIVYRSQFGKEGYSLALFDLEKAKPVSGAPYQVKGLEVNFGEVGNRWFLK